MSGRPPGVPRAPARAGRPGTPRPSPPARRSTAASGRGCASPPPHRGREGRERRREPHDSVLEPDDDRRRGAAEHPAARERRAGVGAREARGLAPPPVLGEARAPVLLGVDRRAVPPRSHDPPAEQVRVPVLREPGHDLRRPDPAEDPLPLAPPLKPQFKPSTLAEVHAQPLGRGSEGGPGADREVVERDRGRGISADRTRPSGCDASATTAHAPSASREIPHSTIATRPRATSVSRQ